jgi:ABC-type glycerol-3-phosphate transport system substrate-binding protein
MNLLKTLGIIKIYLKNKKKSICSSDPVRIDLFIVVALAVLLITPVVIRFSFKANADVKKVNLSLSPRFGELFGSEMTETLLREFKERYPDLRLQMTDGASDILIFDEGEFSVLAAEGALMMIDVYEEEPPLFITDQPAVPLVSFMDMLFYNIGLLSAAGFDRPPKTRDEFIACAAAVSGGNAGAALSLNSADRQALSRDIFSWIWAAGGNIEPAEISNRAVIADINFFGALNRNKVLAPRVFDTTGDQRLEEFANGKIAMIIASTRAIPFLRERMGDGAFGITTVPSSGGGGKYSVCLSRIYAGININCEYPEEARNFLVFLAEKSPLLCAQLKAVPGKVSDLIPGDYVRDDPFYSKAWDIFESSQIVQGFSGKPGAQEYESAFLEELRIYFETERTAQDTAAAIQKRLDAVLAEDRE